MAVPVINPNSKNFDQDLQNVLSNLNSNTRLTITTKLSVTNRNNFLWGAIKSFLVKVLKCKLSLTRNEDVAKILNQFAKNHATLFDPTKTQIIQNYKEIFAKTIQIKIDPATGQAIRDPKAGARLKRCYDLFDLTLSTTKKSPSIKPPSPNPVDTKEALEYLQEIEKYPTLGEKITRSSNFPTEVLRDRYAKIITVCPFDSSNLALLKDFSLLLKQFKFLDLYDQLKIKVKEKSIEIPISDYYKRIPLDVEIMSVQRREMITPEGKTLPADPNPEECIVLKGTDGRSFGVKIVTEDDNGIVVIVITQNDRTREVCVKRDELIERCHLNSLNAQCALESDLAGYIQKNSHILALKNIQRINEKQQRIGTYSPEMSAYLSLAICDAFAERKAFAKNSRGILLSSLHLATPVPEAVKNATIVFGFGKDKIYVRDLSNKEEPLAEGGEAKIYRIKNVISGKEKIMKSYDKYSDPWLPPSAANEVELVEKLYEGLKGKIPGIVKPFHGVISFIGTSANLQTKYLGNLDEILGVKDNVAIPKLDPSIFTTPNEKLEAFYELLVGFEYCVSKHGLMHQDIKSINIFVSKDSQGKAHLHLGDFGSSALTNLKVPSETIRYDAPWSSKYVLAADRYRRETLGKEHFKTHGLGIDQYSYEKDIQTYLTHSKSLDIFALGCVFTEFLAPCQEYMERKPSNDPDKPNIHGHPLPGTFKRNVLDGLCPIEVIDLIEQMVQEDPLKRPTIETVVSILKKVLPNVTIPPIV